MDKNITQNNHIKKIEELSMNAWPSYKIELYDKWLIRFSHQYTYRTNCVEQIGPSSISIVDKVKYCEDVYARYHTPCSFKINPLMSEDFDSYLSSEGYDIKHETNVMTMSLENYIKTEPVNEEFEIYGRNSNLPTHVYYDDNITVTVSDTITDNWITQLFKLNGTTNPTHIKIVPSMFKAIPKETIVTCIEKDGQMVASGLGILDRGDLGIYAIYIAPECRRHHYANAICNTIIQQGLRHNARYAYLQVVKNNDPAVHLYEGLGFKYDYTYWFRSKNIEY